MRTAPNRQYSIRTLNHHPLLSKDRHDVKWWEGARDMLTCTQSIVIRLKLVADVTILVFLCFLLSCSHKSATCPNWLALAHVSKPLAKLSRLWRGAMRMQRRTTHKQMARHSDPGGAPCSSWHRPCATCGVKANGNQWLAPVGSPVA